MKAKLTLKILCFCILHSAFCLSASAQTTAFGYQGFLTDAGAPATGLYDFTFTLYDAVTSGSTVGSTNVINDLGVTNGFFSVTLNYGAAAFPGADRWLQIAVRPGASTGPYTNVTPRQPITPTPYAIRAANFSGAVSNAQLSGTYGSAVTFSNAANVIRGTLSGSGAGVSNVNALTLSTRTAADFWQLDGNNVGLGQILGSTNNQVVQLVANGFPALRLEPNSMALPNLVGGSGTIAAGVYAAAIGGGFANNIQSNSVEAVIAGGSFNTIGPGDNNSAIGGGDNNKIQANSSFATIAGGESHVIETNGNYAFIGGGLQNSLQGNNSFSSIVGGNANTLQVSANYSFIGGGRNNTNGATTSVIAGGQGNVVQAGADRSFIGGGLQNITTGANGMVPGGFANSAASQAFAAGRRAKANHSGAFVWGDTTDADVASTVADSVTMRASGGYRLFSNAGLTLGVSLAANGTAWAIISDRNAKKNIQPVDGKAVLEKLAQVPVQKWNYKAEADDAVPHLGPMAQDFKAAFYPGRDDKSITTLEFDGVELAAIQGLNQKLTEELKRRDAENAELKQRLDALEKIVHHQQSYQQEPTH